MDGGSVVGVMMPVEPYSPDWFRLRCGCFTASEIYKLMTDPRSAADKKAGNLSVTANTYVLQKVHEKLTGKLKNGISNFATEWGIENEPLALKWYAKLSGNTLHDPYLTFHESIQGFSCTPDRFVNEDGLVEVKCPANGENHLAHCFIDSDEHLKAEHPNHYWQMMAQMAITGRQWCDFVSFDPRVTSNAGMFIYRLNIDEAAVLALEDRVNKAREVYNGYYELLSK